MKRTFETYIGKFRYAHAHVVVHIASMALDGTTREVICDFEGRRRPVSFCYSESNSVKEAHEGLFSAVKRVFADVIRSGEEDSYYLQINNEKHGMIDVLGCVDPVEDGQTVFLRYWTRKSPEDNVSVGCVVGLGRYKR